MPLHTFTGTDAFVVTDLPDAPSTGIVRLGRRILTSSATDLARSITYSFAAFGVQRGGASAGVNAEGDAVDGARAAFVEEVRPLVAGGLHLDAGKGMDPTALAPLDDLDPGRARRSDPQLTAVGVLAAIEAALGPLEGRTVAIEGVGTSAVPAALAAAVVAAGGRVVAASDGEGAVSDPDGIDPGRLAGGAVSGEGAREEPWKIWGAAADVLLCGSKPGVLTHAGVPFVRATAVVPWGQVPLTTKALVELERAGVVVLPDFVTAAGGLLAGYADIGDDAVAGAVRDRIGALVEELHGHAEGSFLGACERAEAFLRTWQDRLPFGRPLAA